MNHSILPNSINIDQLLGTINGGQFVGRTPDIYPIEGKMIEVKYSMPTFEVELQGNGNADIVKQKLVELIVQRLLEDNMIMFGKWEDYSQDVTNYVARIFVTPKGDVQILHKWKKNES